jgi:redox-sensitive bicupin YhaK (pirin superfamily)
MSAERDASREKRGGPGMDETRKIRKIIKGKPVIEGAGVHLKRVFGFGAPADFDPFLLLDDFRSTEPERFLKGFPWHPHRGIETITYMLEGSVEHGDSLGNSGVINPGEVQWMTAGSGIIHQEMPKGDEKGCMGGFQLWANLPASHKMMDPRYREILKEQIPVVSKSNGAGIAVICGEFDGVRGAVKDIVTDPAYLDIHVPEGERLVFPVNSGHTAMAYVIEGRALFGPEKNAFSYDIEPPNYFEMDSDPFISNGDLVLFAGGRQVEVKTEKDGVRFLFMSGRPLGEPVAWRGPIVMNTREELREAFEDLERGTFIRYAG